MNEKFALQMHGIRKTFPGVVALDDISFDIRQGVVHSIVGENGAGKSTLMKVLNGIYQPDCGDIRLFGEAVKIKGPQHALKLGIAMVYQELQFVSELQVLENLFIGRIPTNKYGLVDWKKLRSDAKELLEAEGLMIDPSTKMKELRISDCQMLEIVRATSANAKIIIFDEPTSSLTQGETARLFQKINDLKARGITIIYISHKMDEIFELSDYVTVVRDGAVIETRPVGEFTRDSIITAMVGREMKNIYPKETAEIGDVMLEVKNLTRGKRFRDITFTCRKGEIVGFAGLVGAGRTEVSRAVAGLDPVEAGEVYVEGKQVDFSSVPKAKAAGIATVTEDRRTSGFVGVRSIKENLSLPNLRLFSFRKGKSQFMNHKKELSTCQGMFSQVNVKARSINTQLYTLSGGNQQKVVIGKWLLSSPKILLLDEPTRGIDVGAKYEIYKLMVKMAQEGLSIVMISSELPELLNMCDRLYVMREGRITAELTGADINAETVMHFATEG